MRYKEFSRNAVLEKSLRLFWKNGFRACAISDIVDETAVNRFSLYEEFNNKEGLLLASLQLYKDRYSNKNFEILNEKGDTETILEKFFLSYYADLKVQVGCFVIHIGTELADSDEDVKIFLKGYMDELELLLIQLLERDSTTKDRGEFYARNLIGLFCT